MVVDRARDKRTRPQLLEALWAAEVTCDEGVEIIAEMSAALAVLAGERLLECRSTSCAGHLGPAASKALSSSLAAWRALQDGNRTAAARIAELEGELAALRPSPVAATG